MRMAFYSGCRTCLENANKMVKITKICWPEKSIKDLIIRIVPEMTSTLCDEDFVCKKCINIIKSTMEFIEGCLEVEVVLAEKKARQQTEDIEDDFWQDYEEGDIFENVKNIKNEGEMSPCDRFETVDLDHDYCVKISPKPLSELLFPVLSYYSDEDSNDVSEFEEKKCKPRDVMDPLISFNENTEEGAECNAVSIDDTCNKCKDIHIIENNLMPDENTEDTFTDFKHDTGRQKLLEAKKEKDSFICEICGKILRTSTSLEMHKESHNNMERSYICDKCPKKFKTERRVIAHVKRAHNKSHQRQCDECGKLFWDEKTMRSHQRLVHLKEKPYKCWVCNKVFGRRDYVQKHMAVHTGILAPAEARRRKNARKPYGRRNPKYGISLRDTGKPVPCKICGKILKSVHLLKVHLEAHIKIRRFKCKFCNIAFTLRSNRDRHQKSHDADPENKFRCDICWKRLKTEEDLAQHVVLHENRPPRHCCYICGEKFHRKYLLDNHHTMTHLTTEDLEKAEEEIMCQNLLEYANVDYTPG